MEDHDLQGGGVCVCSYMYSQGFGIVSTDYVGIVCITLLSSGGDMVMYTACTNIFPPYGIKLSQWGDHQEHWHARAAQVGSGSCLQAGIRTLQGQSIRHDGGSNERNHT